jgi:hypothetical protein
MRRDRSAFMPPMHGVVQSFLCIGMALNESHRVYHCSKCGVEVRICRRCDRGQVYCRGACGQERRRECLRRAGARYQSSRRGALRHAARQRAWRCRRAEIVTHQAYEVPGAVDRVLAPCTDPVADDAQADPAVADRAAAAPEVALPAALRLVIGSPMRALRWVRVPHCHICGQRLGRRVRSGPLRGGP